jgi:hypothetical protein
MAWPSHWSLSLRFTLLLLSALHLPPRTYPAWLLAKASSRLRPIPFYAASDNLSVLSHTLSLEKQV